MEQESSNEEIERLQSLLEKDAGHEEFVRLAKLMSETRQDNAAAREICFRGLNASPQNHLGRLVLAKLFYLDGLNEFCVRELSELTDQVEAPSLKRLLEAFSVYPTEDASKESAQALGNEADDDEVVAEFDIDADFSEAFDELEEE